MPLLQRFAVTVTLAWAACGLAQVSPDPVFEPATPESQGVGAEAIGALDELAASFVEKDYAVGSELLILRNRRIIFHKAYGDADRESHTPWAVGTGSGTVCNIRSMTKTLTGAAAQILIDRGELSLDDPAAKYLPGFDNDKSREITVRQLLTHRSGLPLTVITRAIDQYPDLLTLANAAGEGGPEFEPGSKFWYSDAGSDSVAAIVEVITGETIDAFVTREILRPLEMTDSFYGIDGADPRFGRIGGLYLGQVGAWVRFWTPADGKPLYPFAWGSQTVYSTALDYAKFLGMWMDGGLAPDGTRVLSEAAVERTLTPASPMSMLGSDARFPTDYRGLSVYYGQMSVLYCAEPEGGESGALPAEPVIISHSGSDGTIAWAWPELDLMVLYFTQSRGGTSVLRMEETIDRVLIHPGEVAPVAEVPEEFRPFVGVYIANFASFENERFEVLVKGGKLALDIPSQMVFELLGPDADGNRPFAIAPEQIKVSFHLGEDGQADALQIHQSGMSFDVPREGSAAALEQSKAGEVSREVLDSVCGRYHDPESDGVLEVFLDEEGVLSIKAPPEMVFQLRPSRDAELTWVVKQNPAVSLTFERGEDGKIVSMTRHIPGQSLAMPRVEE
jgi:CubicO group peptidase (beta-lactamase class C family)